MWSRGLLLAALLFTPQLLSADIINLGFISYDQLVPPGTGPGVNAFDISNFTGDPLGGGFALPPDFPVYTFLTFTNASLTLNDGSPMMIDLGAIAPGPLTPPAELQFPDTTSFSSAVFSATLSQTSLLLSDGTTFITDSPTITATILPASGPSLSPGDFAVISTTGSVSTVPEPSSFALIGTAVLCLFVRAKVRKF